MRSWDVWDLPSSSIAILVVTSRVTGAPQLDIGQISTRYTVRFLFRRYDSEVSRTSITKLKASSSILPQFSNFMSDSRSQQAQPNNKHKDAC